MVLPGLHQRPLAEGDEVAGVELEGGGDVERDDVVDVEEASAAARCARRVVLEPGAADGGPLRATGWFGHDTLWIAQKSEARLGLVT
jgi:hypothetical protein